MAPHHQAVPRRGVPTVTRADLVAGLQRLGLRRGDRVMVHSALSRFGFVLDGAEAVIAALVDCVTAEGLLMMPTMTFDRWPFHREKTPSCTGRITETFRVRDDVHRSSHPTHSVAAWGNGAREIVAGHESAGAFGPESPLGRLVRDNGKVLLLGVTHTSNSAIHVAEAIVGVPYYGKRRTADVLDDEGGTHVVTLTGSPGCSRGFDNLEPLLVKRKWIKMTSVGFAELRLMQGGNLIAACEELLAEAPQALLCDYPDCASCGGAREILSTEGR